jgi:hypothetical protein
MKATREEMEKFFLNDTTKHVNRVSEIMGSVSREIYTRGQLHDASKFNEPEKSFYMEPVWNLNNPESKIKFGTPEHKEQTKAMGPGWDHHKQTNDHHAEHFGGEDPVSKMTLIQLLEMCADWISASERKGNDPLLALEDKDDRFSPQMKKVISNTVRHLQKSAPRE